MSPGFRGFLLVASLFAAAGASVAEAGMQFSCPDADTAVVVVSGYDVPACASGQGVWSEEGDFLERNIADADVSALLGGALLVLVIAFGFGEVRRLMR